MRRLIIFATFCLLLFPNQVIGEIVLTPGSASIIITSIVLEPSTQEAAIIDPDNFLGLYGDPWYLNIIWNARYIDNIERPIGIRCYLNCPYISGDLDTVCNGYQNCSYEGVVGEHFCTIIDPNYIYDRSSNNRVYCKFYYPPDPLIEFLPYPNTTFKPINFEIATETQIGVTVGDSFILPITIINKGLFQDLYYVNVTPDSNSLSFLFVENGYSQTKKIYFNQSSTVYPRITVLATPPQNLYLSIKVNSNISRYVNELLFCSNDCAWLDSNSLCIDNYCWLEKFLALKGNYKIMSEYSTVFLLEMFVISIFLFLLWKYKFKKSKK